MATIRFGYIVNRYEICNGPGTSESEDGRGIGIGTLPGRGDFECTGNSVGTDFESERYLGYGAGLNDCSEDFDGRGYGHGTGNGTLGYYGAG